jgi:sulfite exporter TauE/SafE
MMNSIFVTALILGLSANLHCLGMCGPIALSAPLNHSSLFHKISSIIQYNAGRIGVYSLLGFLTGFVGLSLSTLGVLQWASMIAGAGIILYAWKNYLEKFLPSLSLPLSFIPSGTMSFILHKSGPWKLILLGILNGILPCGMVYLGLIHSLLSPTPLEASMAMFFFGIGTLPIMVSLQLVSTTFTQQLRRRLTKAVPIVLTLVGSLMILRGANLGIPFVSPSIQKKQTQKVQNETVSIRVDCCSKPGIKVIYPTDTSNINQ